MKSMRLLFIYFIFLFYACEPDRKQITPLNPEKEKANAVVQPVASEKRTPTVIDTSEFERRLINEGLVDVRRMDSTIKVDLKYSTENNFLNIDVYGDFNKCYLQKDVALKLVSAQKLLKEKYPYYSLLIYDAVRPRSIQQIMWDTINVLESERPKYLSNPEYGSLHNYGAAVDVSIINDSGIELDMGTEYDYFGELAYPVKEPQMILREKLTYRQVLNRELLREVMEKAGFFNIQTEWWHFNSSYRKEASQKYKLIE